MNSPSTSLKYCARSTGPSPLREAAARLAEAAAKLSAAAQAMALASEKLGSANAASQTEGAEPTEFTNDNQVSGSPMPDEKSVEDGESDEECTNPEDSDYYISGRT
jgi:hypothetical protein